MLPRKVRILDVGPRDGLQNEAKPLSADIKLELIDRLGAAGLPAIETTAFVSPKWVPQMADHTEVTKRLKHRPGVDYSVLVPNIRGYEAAIAAGAGEVAIFAAATEVFSKRNTNCTIDQSFERFAPIMSAAQAANVRVRGYISVALGCPYAGPVPAEQVAAIAARLFAIGCYDVSLGDTIGAGTPAQTRAMFEACVKHVPIDRLAGHFHDTYGQALANIYASLEMGVTNFDTSVAGLGGCPYAKGATGNVATEDVVYMLDGLGIETGIDLGKVAEAGAWISGLLERAPSRAGKALLAKRAAAAEAVAA